MHNNGQHCWVSCIYYILKELDMLKMFKSPLTCGAREMGTCKMRNEIYRNETKSKRNEINRNEIDRNETKQSKMK